MTTNNADRFTGLADIYAEHRPHYPAPIIQALVERCALTSNRLAVDIGCGTGIATRPLAEALPDWRIIAADPNADMLTKARETLSHCKNVEFVQTGAEVLPGGDEQAGLLLAAQALHWFDEEAFFAEAARVLCSGGTLAILYNQRQTTVSAALNAIESYFEDVEPTYSRNYRDRDIPALLDGLDQFVDVTRVREVWLQPTSVDDLVNYFMSRSMVQPIAAKVGLGKFRQRIGDIADQHARAGMLDLPFATELDMATRL